MPPWNRLHVDKPSEKELRRRTILDPTPPATAPAQSSQEDEQLRHVVSPGSPQRARRTRDSVVSLNAVTDIVLPLGRNAPVLELPEVTEKPSRPHRFSMLRFRHASDSQLSKTAREHADTPPPMPSCKSSLTWMLGQQLMELIVNNPPSIITTAPTQDNLDFQKRKSAFSLPRKHKFAVPKKMSQMSLNVDGGNQDTPNPPSRVTFDEPRGFRSAGPSSAPPPYGDESSSALALPVTRVSESSRSDGSSGDHGVFATTTTTHTVSTTTTFFRLPRRKKDKGPLFPLPPKVKSAASTPRMSTGRPSDSPTRQYFSYQPEGSSIHGSPRRSGQHSPGHAALASSSIAFATSGAGPLRSGSRSSSRSEISASAGRASTSRHRGRASTLGSVRRALEDDSLPTPPLPQSTRTSTSTAPRPSLGGLFSLSRLRQSSEPMFPRHGHGSGPPGTPVTTDSKQPSFSLAREPPIVVPERQEGDTPAKYLARLEEVVNRSAIVPLLSKTDDEFTKNVLRSYMRRFKFFEDPLDMAIRKMLMHIDLPKETQQIDRTLQSFADRYHECNPGIFVSPGLSSGYFCFQC